MKRDDDTTIWKRLLFVIVLVVIYLVVVVLLNPPTEEEPIRYYEEFEQYITPQSAYVLNLTERILGKPEVVVEDIPQVQRYISNSFNVSGNTTTYPRRTIEDGYGSTNSLIALEMSILYSLEPYLMVVDYEDNTKKRDNHVALFMINNYSALLSDFTVESSKMSYICRFKNEDFVYDMLVHTPVKKYDIKYVANHTNEIYFNDNLEFVEWLDFELSIH